MALKNRSNGSVCALGLPTNFKANYKSNSNSHLPFLKSKDTGIFKKHNTNSISVIPVEQTPQTPTKNPFEIKKTFESPPTDDTESLYSPLLIGSTPKPDRSIEEEFTSVHGKVQQYYNYITQSSGMLEDINHYYAFERAREAAMKMIKLGNKEFDFRRTVIDELMLRTACLKEQNLPITRATLQLAVSLLDRTIIELMSLQDMFQIEIKKSFIIACSLLSTAVIFEKPNGALQLTCPIQRYFLLEIHNNLSCHDTAQHQKGILIFQKLQHYILDTVGFKVNTPLCVEFAHYFMIELGYDLSYIADDTQLVAYLLDCFVIHDSAVFTPASKAAAAAVTLMRRIFNPGKPMNQLWNNNMIDISGYCLKELRPVLNSMNEMLLKHADSLSGLKALHKNGWADISWQMP